MIRTALMSAALVFVTACGADRGDDFRAGVPNGETVAVSIPGGSVNQGLTGVSQQGLEGAKSEFYVLTRGATVVVNGATVAILKLVETITDYRPTSVNGNVAVWGPHTEDLSPTTWKLTVTKTGEQTYDYVLEGKPKTEDDSKFVAILSGSHTAAIDANGEALKGFGNGNFLLDWDNAQQLPEHDNNVGTAEFTYSRLSETAEATVDVAFRQVKDDGTTQRVDADYGYKKAPGAGGSFTFGLLKNHEGSSTAALEKLTIHSRWADGGAGRSDIKISGGDLGDVQYTLSDCWDTNFISQYQDNNFDMSREYGDVATDCVFQDAVFGTP